MRFIVLLFVDCVLVGLIYGIVALSVMALLNVGGLQASLNTVPLGGLPVLSIALFSGMVVAAARFTWALVRLEMRDDRDDALRRRFLIPAQRPPRR